MGRSQPGSDTLHGLIGWQIIIYNMYNDTERNVTIVDTLLRIPN